MPRVGEVSNFNQCAHNRVVIHFRLSLNIMQVSVKNLNPPSYKNVGACSVIEGTIAKRIYYPLKTVISL